MNTSAEQLLIKVRALDHPDAVSMIAAIQQLYLGLYGGADDDTTHPDDFAPPDGLFLMGYLDGAAVASGGWRRFDGESSEIKRMFVADGVRGRGFGRQLLAELERTAVAAGARRMLLNTGFRQQPAIALYESAGYRQSEFRYGRYADQPGALFFAKSL